jgi:hypothetical protein
MTEMMMVHRIIPYSDSGPVIWVFIFIRGGNSIDGKESLSDNAS